MSSVVPAAGALSSSISALRLHPVQEPAHGGPHPRPPGERLDEHHAPRVGVLLQTAQQLGERGRDRARPFAFRQGAHRLERPPGEVPVGREHALFAVRELLVEGGARDAGVGADLGDAEVLIALPARELDDRVDQPLALARTRERKRPAHGALALVSPRLRPCVAIAAQEDSGLSDARERFSWTPVRFFRQPVCTVDNRWSSRVNADGSSIFWEIGASRPRMCHRG